MVGGWGLIFRKPQMCVFSQESWLWRPAMCWDNYPNQVSDRGCLELEG